MSDTPETFIVPYANALRRLGVLAAIVTVLGGALGIANQAEIQEPHWVATRGFVRDSVTQSTSKLEARTIRMQIYLAQSEYSRLENELANKRVLLEQNPTMPQGVRDSINEQIRALARNLEFTKNQLDDLRREESGRRP